MRSLAAVLLAFPLLLGLQALVWRVRRRGGHYLALSGLTVLVLLVSLMTFAALDAAGHGSALPLPRTGLDYWGFLILYTSLALSYMITYSAVQADSPTMAMLLRIEASGPGGRTREALIQDLGDDILILPRLNDLLLGELAELRGDRYCITPRGSVLAGIYIRYRALLGMEKGG